MHLLVGDIPDAFVICLHFRTTVVAAAAFLDAFQKVADMATNTRGKQTGAGFRGDASWRRVRSCPWLAAQEGGV